ncbi:MAG TPA: hypothetical protein GX506_12240 [Firmicutes bacterium]|nr:hypothetical protein [Bacillota bacterium]
MEGIFAVITCDLRRSREITPRQPVQDAIKRALERINAEYATIIVSGFSFTLGDEWQGLIKEPRLAYELVWAMRRYLPGIRIYAGIGLGEISTAVAPVQEMDGPAFHRAREAVELAKSQQRGVAFVSGDPEGDPVVNSLLRLIEGTWNRATQRQVQVVLSYEQTRNMSMTAERLGITKQAVSKILKAAMWDEVIEAREGLKVLLVNLSRLTRHESTVSESPVPACGQEH